jgi:hypothetical protein
VIAGDAASVPACCGSLVDGSSRCDSPRCAAAPLVTMLVERGVGIDEVGATGTLEETFLNW